MYYAEPQRKQEFTLKFEHQVKIYEQFLTALKAIIPVISQYEGKVVNVRLLTSIKEVVKSNLFVNLTVNRVRFSVGSTERMYLNTERRFENVDTTTYEFTLSVNDNKRLDSIKSIETIKSEIEYLTNEIADIQTDISVNYDEEVKAYQKLKKEIEEYKKTFSSRLRRSMRLDY